MTNHGHSCRIDIRKLSQILEPGERVAHFTPLQQFHLQGVPRVRTSGVDRLVYQLDCILAETGRESDAVAKQIEQDVTVTREDRSEVFGDPFIRAQPLQFFMCATAAVIDQDRRERRSPSGKTRLPEFWGKA